METIQAWERASPSGDALFLDSKILLKNLNQAPYLTEISVKLFTSAIVSPGFSNDFAYNIYLGSAGKEYINYTYSFIGYRFMELAGRNAITARADIYYEFIKNHHLVFKGNIGKLQPTFDELFSSDILLDGYGLAYSYDSPVGPLEFTVMSSSNHGNIYSYLSLGFWF